MLQVRITIMAYVNVHYYFKLLFFFLLPTDQFGSLWKILVFCLFLCNLYKRCSFDFSVTETYFDGKYFENIKECKIVCEASTLYKFSCWNKIVLQY